MRNVTRFSSLLVVAALTVGYTYAGQSRQGPLEGAWEGVGDLPALHLFTEGHYSMMAVTRPRELFADPANVTDAEWLAACGGISTTSGTYEVSGSAVRLQIMVAKHPNAMAVGHAMTFEYSIEGDTLRMDPDRGPAWTFVRLR